MKKHAAFLLIAAVFIFHALNNFLVLKSSSYQLRNDSIHFLERAQRIGDILKTDKLSPAYFSAIYTDITGPQFTPHPSLFLYTAQPFFLIENDKNAAGLANLPYLLILLFSVYGAGKALFDRRTGLLAVFLVSMLPGIFGLSRVFLLDFALAAISMLTLYFFAAGHFEKFSFSLLCGLTVASGLLIKEAYLIFILPAIAYFLLARRQKSSGREIFGFCLSLCLGVILALRYYLVGVNYNFFKEVGVWVSNPDPFSYLKVLYAKLLFPGFFLLLVPALFFSLRRKKYFLPCTLIILLILLSFSPNKQDRFILPVLPYIALIIAYFVAYLSRISRPVTAVILGLSLAQFFVISYCPGIYKLKINKQSIFPRPVSDYADLTTVAREKDWETPAARIVKLIKAKSPESKISLGLYVANNDLNFALVHALLEQKIPYSIHVPAEAIDMSVPGMAAVAASKRDVCFDDPGKNFNFVIIQENLGGKEMSADCLIKLADFMKRSAPEYEFLAEVSFPDGSTGNVYCRKRPGA